MSAIEKYLDKVNNEAINDFRGDFKWLSNFAKSEVEWEGLKFPFVENAYQAAKCPNVEDMIPFTTCTAREARNMGQKVNMRDDWEAVKCGVMNALLVQKFTQPHFREILLATEDIYLIESNSWNDLYFGQDNVTLQGINMLGCLLMLIRAQLRLGLI